MNIVQTIGRERLVDRQTGQSPVQDSSPPESKEGCAAQGRWLAEVARQEHMAQPLHTQVSQILHRISLVAEKESQPGSQSAGQDETKTTNNLAGNTLNHRTGKQS